MSAAPTAARTRPCLDLNEAYENAVSDMDCARVRLAEQQVTIMTNDASDERLEEMLLEYDILMDEFRNTKRLVDDLEQINTDSDRMLTYRNRLDVLAQGLSNPMFKKWYNTRRGDHLSPQGTLIRCMEDLVARTTALIDKRGVTNCPIEQPPQVVVEPETEKREERIAATIAKTISEALPATQVTVVVEPTTGVEVPSAPPVAVNELAAAPTTMQVTAVPPRSLRSSVASAAPPPTVSAAPAAPATAATSTTAPLPTAPTTPSVDPAVVDQRFRELFGRPYNADDCNKPPPAGYDWHKLQRLMTLLSIKPDSKKKEYLCRLLARMLVSQTP